jgi:uncharacterized protein YciW
MRDDMIEFWEDGTLTYYERAADGLVYSRPYTENELARYAKERQLDMLGAAAKEAIPYLDERIDKCLAYLALASPSSEETTELVKVLADLASYNAGTLKRIIVVLGDMTSRPV